MESAEWLIRSIVGDIRSSIYPLACASEVIGHLFFKKQIPLDDIQAKQVYPAVAEQTGLSRCAASRRIQRLNIICWECMCEKDLVCQYIGAPLQYRPDACRLIGYLTVYANLQISFFEAIQQDPTLLFAPKFDGRLEEWKALSRGAALKKNCPPSAWNAGLP